MVIKRKNNAKTATTIAAFVGTTLQPASPLRPQYSSPSSMRLRRFSVTPSTGNTWKNIPSTRISGEYGSSSTILMGSPFENYNNDNEIDIASNNASLLDPVLTKSAAPTKEKRDNSSTADTLVTEDDLDLNYNTANSTMTTIAVLSKEDSDANERDTFFSIPLGALKENMNIDEEKGQRLAIASEKFKQFLKEETPPISVVLLNVVAVIWGSQHAIIKTIVDDSDPAAFTFLRFGLGSLIASPYLPGVQQAVRKTTNKIKSFCTEDDYNDHKKDEIDLWKPWRWGIEMGLWMFLGFSLQAIGLQTTTSQRSGFLLYLNVKFVPFFAKVLLGRQISKWTWLSAFAAFSGTALLALDGQSLGLNVGDIWSVMAAVASAMFILRLEKASSEVPKSSELNATSLLVVAMLSGAWLLLSSSGEQIASEVTKTAFAHPLELVYLGAISTALANFIQAKAQKDVPAERASIIYSLDPVYGAFFSWIILGETLGGPQAYIGASIIFAAAATNSLLEFSKSDEINE
jgi:drug/metabolite transporter (DMT)-like permease